MNAYQIASASESATKFKICGKSQDQGRGSPEDPSVQPTVGTMDLAIRRLVGKSYLPSQKAKCFRPWTHSPVSQLPPVPGKSCLLIPHTTSSGPLAIWWMQDHPRSTILSAPAYHIIAKWPPVAPLISPLSTIQEHTLLEAKGADLFTSLASVSGVVPYTPSCSADIR